MIEITPTEVIRVKKYWFLTFRRRVAIRDIASIHIRNFQFSAEILFKDEHERHLMTLIGLYKPDAHRIREMVEKILGV